MNSPLADNIAFIAGNACSEGAEVVSAVTIEQRPDGLLVWLAQNEPPTENAKAALSRISQVLCDFASIEMEQSHTSATDIIERLFDSIIEFSSTKIEHHIGSKHSPLRTKTSRTTKPIDPLFQIVERWHRNIQASHRECDISQHLIEVATSLKNIEQAEKLDNDLLKECIRSAYRLCYFKGIRQPLEKRLRYAQGCKDASPKEGDRCERMWQMDRTHVFQIEKLANYYAVCEDLIQLSSEYRALFTNLQLQVIDIRDQMRGRRVHAEIQAIRHFELCLRPNKSIIPPRVIGLSKSCCYLCRLFIEKHGHFRGRVSRAHNRLYINNWGVPHDAEEEWGQIFKEMAQEMGMVSIPPAMTHARKKSRDTFIPWPIESRANSPIRDGRHTFAPRYNSPDEIVNGMGALAIAK